MKIKADDGESRTPFSMLETRVWTDEKFVKLSRIPPCGQGLWLYLLTGPHTAQTRTVPGVYVVSRAAIAEALQWGTDEFDAVFSPISRHKMAIADWEHQILWLPNALRRHMPRSPHNVLSWRAGWDLIPDCALKRRIYDAIKPVIFARGEAFQEAFKQAVKPVAHRVAGNGTRCAKRQPSARSRSDHPLPDGAVGITKISGPLPEFRSNHKPKDGRTIGRKKVGPYTDVDVDKDKTPNPKSVNGATAPLAARERAPKRVREDSAKPEAPPDKPASEFASVRRFEAMAKRAPSQGDLLDDDAGKPAPDKDSADHDSEDGRTMSGDMVEPSTPYRAGRRSRKASPDKAPGPDTAPTWAAYSDAFFRRYGVNPIRNAPVNSQMLHFVERIGQLEAPAVARFYVEHNNGYYVRRSHAIGDLLHDAESLRTQWATRRPMTATEAAMTDRTATNANAFAPLIAEARERERNEAEHGN
ncbi:Replication protein 15 [Burkholderia pseudomallei]|nr:Replication protein 15 [Burkholderia pseudomallei]